MEIGLVCFDMDGVIFQSRNFWLELHKRLGTYDEGKELTEKYLDNDYPALVSEVVGRLWKGMDANPYYRLVEEMPYVLGAVEALDEIKRRGMKTALVTSGPKDLALRAKRDCGFDYVYANSILVSEGIFTGEFLSPVGFGRSEKLQIVRDITSGELLLPSQVAFVGDGDNDVLVCVKVGLSIAFNSDSEKLLAVCNVKISEPDLRKILDYL